MQIVFNRLVLCKAMRLAAAVAPARSPRPILRYAYLAASKGGQVVISATDMDMSVMQEIKAESSDCNVSLCLPAELLAGILSECDDELVSIHAGESAANCKLIAGQDTFDIMGFLPSDWPAIETTTTAKNLSVFSGELAAALARTCFAVATESGRYTVNGVCLEVTKDRLNIVGTDSRRMSWSNIAAGGEWDYDKAAILPRQAAARLAELLAGQDPNETISISAANNALFFRCGSNSLRALMIDGCYPKYQKVVPAPSKKVAEFDVEELRAGLRRAEYLTGPETDSIKFSLREPGFCTLSSSTPGKGSAEVLVGVDWPAKDMDVLFSPKYLSDALAAVGQPKVKIELTDDAHAAVIRTDNWVYVIMPVTKE